MEIPLAIVKAGHEVNGLDIIFFERESIALTKPQPLVGGFVVTQGSVHESSDRSI
jgi:hypothetical protein